jgi:hypothetical protein
MTIQGEGYPYYQITSTRWEVEEYHTYSLTMGVMERSNVISLLFLKGIFIERRCTSNVY